MTVDACRLLPLTKVERPEGNLTPVYPGEHIPFEVARVYYLYDIPGGASRAGHAHHRLQQLIVAAMGSFKVTVDDGQKRAEFELNRAYTGLYVPRMMWREITEFSPGAICLVLASRPYEEGDYIYDLAEFRRMARG